MFMAESSGHSMWRRDRPPRVWKEVVPMPNTQLLEPEPPQRPQPPPERPVAIGMNATLIGVSADLVPMRMPADVWAWWVTAVDLDSDDRPVQLQGCWVQGHPPADGPYDGDLVIRLHPSATPAADRVGVEMLLAYRDRWTRVATWPDLDRDWPTLIAPTAHIVMSLHTALLEADSQVLDTNLAR